MNYGAPQQIFNPDDVLRDIIQPTITTVTNLDTQIKVNLIQSPESNFLDLQTVLNNIYKQSDLIVFRNRKTKLNEDLNRAIIKFHCLNLCDNIIYSQKNIIKNIRYATKTYSEYKLGRPVSFVRTNDIPFLEDLNYFLKENIETIKKLEEKHIKLLKKFICKGITENIEYIIENHITVPKEDINQEYIKIEEFKKHFDSTFEVYMSEHTK